MNVNDDQEPVLVAYRTRRLPRLRLVPAAADRAWIEATRSGFARRCLPLLVANQAGWFVLNSYALRATWDGGAGKEALAVEYQSGRRPYPAVSHFGHGILTWHIPYLFRTPPGVQLLARGPANWPKDGVSPLEGLVETDWAVATFTMNYQLTRPGLAVAFERGEPICMIVPQRCDALEALQPAVRDLADDPGLQESHKTWVKGRATFLAELKEPGSAATRQRWQKHYFRGAAPDGTAASEHRTKLRLRAFDDPGGVCFRDEADLAGSSAE